MTPSARSKRVIALSVALVAAVSVACQESAGPGGGGGDPVPTSLVVSPSSVDLDAFGATQQLTGTVRDQNGSVMSGQTVSWAITSNGSATVDIAGLVTAVADGVDTVTATAGGLNAEVEVTVAQVPGQVTKASGDAQAGVVGQMLPDSIVAIVADAQGNPMAGISVAFTVTSGGGSVSPDTVVSDALGQAAAEWTLGTTSGTQEVEASPTTGSGTTTFTATADHDVATDLAIVSGNSQSQQSSNPLSDPLVAEVVDQYGNAVDGFSVDFTITGGTGSLEGGGTTASTVTGVNGEASTTWTLGPEIGAQTVDATATGLTGSPATFTATSLAAQPSSVAIQSGDGQTGLVGFGVNDTISVLVTDLVGSPFPGATVDFVVTSGGGSVVGGTAVSDGSGVATLGSWILGPSAGSNVLEASVAGVDTVTFAATGATAEFDIEVRFINTPTAGQQEAFDSAEVKWERLIYGNLASQAVDFMNPGWCGGSEPAITETVDDLVIYAELTGIDGPGGVLGRAGPCAFRSGSNFPVLGTMFFDTSDLSSLEASGELDEVILHEMGHVLGFGTLWESLGFLQQKSDTAPASIVDTHFDGPQAIESFNELGGGSYGGGSRVPVENDNATYGLGSLNAHWREAVNGTELMTPTLNSGFANLLSKLSVASMGDLGYVVNYAGSDAYTFVPVAPLAGAFGGRTMVDDIWWGPRIFLDPSGRIVRIIRPR